MAGPGRRAAVWAAAGVIGAATLTGCSAGSGAGGSSAVLAGTAAADTWNTGAARTGGKVTWAVGSAVTDWNAMSTDGSSFDATQVLNGIYPGAFVTNPSYDITLNTALLAGATQTGNAPQTVVYQIQPGAVWSDGAPIAADDFAYTWQVQNGADAAIPAAATTGYDQIKSVTGSSDGKTVTVVYSSPFPDWKSLFAFLYPAHVAARHGSAEQSFAWFAANPPTVSGGPFAVAAASPDGSEVTEARNPRYYGPPANLDQVVFRAIPDQGQQVAALQDQQVDGIYPQPTTDLVGRLSRLGRHITYQIDSGMDFEHLDFNLRNPALGDPTFGQTLRTAMFTALDRGEVLDKTVRLVQPGAVALDNRMFVPGQAGYQDDITAYGLGSGNLLKARALLTAAGFTGATAGGRLTAPGGSAIPAFTMVYSRGNTARQTTCGLFAAAMAGLGITVNVAPTDDLGATLAQSAPGHGYDIVDFAWAASPFPASADQPDYTSTGGDDFGGYANRSVDGWMAEAATTADPAVSLADLDRADRQISQDAYTLPLYQLPTLIAVQPDLVNAHGNGTASGPTYNVGEWGLKKAS